MSKELLVASVLTSLIVSSAWAQKTSVKMTDLPTTENTTITVEKDRRRLEDDFKIVDGQAEVVGDPDNEVAKAYTNWKNACTEWRNEMKSMNKDNQVLVLNCNKAEKSKEEYLTIYKSTGTYKLRVRVREEVSKAKKAN